MHGIPMLRGTKETKAMKMADLVHVHLVAHAQLDFRFMHIHVPRVDPTLNPF